MVLIEPMFRLERAIYSDDSVRVSAGFGPPPQSSCHWVGFSLRNFVVSSMQSLAAWLFDGSRMITSTPRDFMNWIVSLLEALAVSAITTRGMPNWIIAPVHMKQGWRVV